jgi:hypothetical protein
MECPSPVIFDYLAASAPEGGGKQTVECVRQTKIAPERAQRPSRKPDESLLRLTCKNIEDIIDAKLNWP